MRYVNDVDLLHNASSKWNQWNRLINLQALPVQDGNYNLVSQPPPGT